MKTATQEKLQVGARVITNRRIIGGEAHSDSGVITKLKDGGYCVVQWDSDDEATEVLMMSLRPQETPAQGRQLVRLPWRIDKDNGRAIEIVDAIGDLVFIEDFGDIPSEYGAGHVDGIVAKSRANFYTALKAVNQSVAFDKLVEAMDALLTQSLAIHGDDLCDHRTIQRAIEALRLAREGRE